MHRGILEVPERCDFGKTSTQVSDFIVGLRGFSQKGEQCS